MKKLLQIIILSLFIFNNVSVKKRYRITKSFKELKNSEDRKAIEIENKHGKFG